MINKLLNFLEPVSVVLIICVFTIGTFASIYMITERAHAEPEPAYTYLSTETYDAAGMEYDLYIINYLKGEEIIQFEVRGTDARDVVYKKFGGE